MPFWCGKGLLFYKNVKYKKKCVFESSRYIHGKDCLYMVIFYYALCAMDKSIFYGVMKALISLLLYEEYGLFYILCYKNNAAVLKKAYLSIFLQNRFL